MPGGQQGGMAALHHGASQRPAVTDAAFQARLVSFPLLHLTCIARQGYYCTQDVCV